MIRQIVSTATYRQSAQCRPELLEKDPQNRLLARGPRFRLDAEVIRDVALAASGLLSDRLGGPSVFPPQPAGTSEKLEFAGFAWPTNQDDNRYRRGLYTHWKRTALYPSFSLFDAPNRTATCTRRNVSTTPLQALVTLNDPVFFEAAVHLARRMLDGSEGGDKPSSANNDARTTGEDAIRTGFRLCLSRHPADDEVAELSRLLEEERRRLASDPETAVRQLGGEAIVRQFPRLNEVDWAACSTLANVLLNLDETITRE
jgi:hypothetical protein